MEEIILNYSLLLVKNVNYGRSHQNVFYEKVATKQ